MLQGLQDALDGKVDDSQVLTNVPVNAKFTDTNTINTAGATDTSSKIFSYRGNITSSQSANIF